MGLALTGTGATNHAAHGSRITVKSTSHGTTLTQTKEVQAMAGFSAQADPRLLFGLGDDAPAEVDVTIEWHPVPLEVRKLAIDP